MNLYIDPTEPIATVKENFQLHYPYLKIEFYPPKQETKNEAEKKPLKNYMMVLKAQPFPQEGVYRFNPSIKVEELEKSIKELFGIKIEVFRNSGNSWIQTRNSRHLTLAEQTALALETENQIFKGEAYEYHDQL